MSHSSLAGKVVVITGASRGIGRATAIEFARRGARVALVARNAELLKQVASQVNQRGETALATPADVSAPDQVQAVVDRVIQEWGTVDILVNNAGITVVKPLLEMQTEEVYSVVNVNLLGSILMTRAALPTFVAKGRGHVVFVSSVLGKRGFPSQAVYSASKFALAGFSEALRAELAASEVTVSCIFPSSTDTDMNRAVRGETGSSFARLVRRLFMSTPEAVARVVVNTAVRPRREVVISLPAKLVVLLNKTVPSLLDWLFGRSHRGDGS